MYFSINFLLYSFLPLCLNSFLTRQARLGTLALTSGSCGPVVRSWKLGVCFHLPFAATCCYSHLKSTAARKEYFGMCISRHYCLKNTFSQFIIISLTELYWEPLWEVPPVTRSWRKYRAGKAVRDPIHDEVMRRIPDRQARLGWGTLQVGLGLYPTLYPPPFSAVVLICPAADSCVACQELSYSSFTE